VANISVNRKSGFVLRRGVMRRESLWLGLAHSQTTLAAVATVADTNALAAATLALRPFTIVRSLIDWLVRSDQSAASESFIGSIGYSVVSAQAKAVGVTAEPTPATDQGSDAFFLYSTWQGLFRLVGTAIQEDLVSRRIDSKAMRKVEDGFDIAFCIEAGLIGNGVTIATGGRILIKLH